MVPVLGVVLGVGPGLAVIAQGDTGYGVFIIGLMTAYAALQILFSRRSETVAMLRGETADERVAAIQTKAAAVTGHVLILVLVTGFIVQLVRGEDASLWSALCAVGGITYLLALIVLRQRG